MAGSTRRAWRPGGLNARGHGGRSTPARRASRGAGAGGQGARGCEGAVSSKELKMG